MMTVPGPPDLAVDRRPQADKVWTVILQCFQDPSERRILRYDRSPPLQAGDTIDGVWLVRRVCLQAPRCPAGSQVRGSKRP